MAGRISRWITGAGVLVGLVAYLLANGPSPQDVHAVPVPGMPLFGSVTVSGQAASGGTEVQAKIGGVNYAFAPEASDFVPRIASDGTYGFGSNVFQILADDSQTSAKEGGVGGETVQLFVGSSAEVAGTVAFQSGVPTRVDLSVSSLLSPPPPPAAPPPPAPPPPPAVIEPTPTSTPTPTPTPAPTPTPLPEVLDVVEAIGQAGTTQERVGAVQSLQTTEQKVQALASLEPAVAATIVDQLNDDEASDIIDLSETTVAASILAEVVTSKAGAIVTDLVKKAGGAEKAAEIVTEIVKVGKRVEAAAIVEAVELEQAVDLIEAIVDVQVSAGTVEDIAQVTRASAILENVEEAKAGAILEETGITRVTEIVDVMAEVKLVERLPEMSADKLFQIPAQTLFDNLPSVPVEQLAFEVPPPVDLTLPAPVAVQVSATLAVYQVQDTGELVWAALAGSLAPIDQILGKFARRLSDVEISVEDLAAKPAAAPDFSAAQVVNSYFRIDVESAEPDDVVAAHVTMFVEKEWLEANDIHKWSVQFNRLDEDLGSWVPFPSKRVSEDDERVFYTVSVPGFSVIAITGSKEMPAQIFQVNNLSFNPPLPSGGEDFTVSVVVTNLRSQSAVYPATVWVNSTIEDSDGITVPEGATLPVSFVLNLPEGSHRVRIDRELRDLTVGPAVAAPTPTPVVVTLTAVPVVVEVEATPTHVPPTPVPPTPAPVLPTEALPTLTPVPPAEVPTAVVVAPLEEEEGAGVLIFIVIVIGIVAGVAVVGGTGYFVVVRRRSGLPAAPTTPPEGPQAPAPPA